MKGMPPALRDRLLAVVAAATLAGAGLYKTTEEARTDKLAVQLAREIGLHYESSGSHIGTPYIDRAGKGQPWTVCAGVTGPEVDPRKTYTPADCERLELAAYTGALAIAKNQLRHWGQYNPYVRASFIDVAYNVPSALITNTTLLGLANTGDLVGACLQMPRWVYGTVRGQKQQLPGLINRRGATRELCEEWGRDGHISVGALVSQAPAPENPDVGIPISDPEPAVLPPSLVIVPASEAPKLPWWQRIFSNAKAAQ